MDPNSDAELVRAVRAGDRQAFADLVDRYQRQIYGLACILLGDRSEAEDITQETFLRAWVNFDLLSDPGKFGPWVRRIVFGVSIDWLRAFRPDLYRLAAAPCVSASASLTNISAPRMFSGCGVRSSLADSTNGARVAVRVVIMVLVFSVLSYSLQSSGRSSSKRLMRPW